MKTAIITGVSGQDGTYLAELLLSKKYRVIGTTIDPSKIAEALPFGAAINFKLIHWLPYDLIGMINYLSLYQPSEIYNGKKIYYSLGNFIFDQYFNEDVRNGLGVLVTIDKKTKKTDFAEKYFYLDNDGQTIEKTLEK